MDGFWPSHKDPCRAKRKPEGRTNHCKAGFRLQQVPGSLLAHVPPGPVSAVGRPELDAAEGSRGSEGPANARRRPLGRVPSREPCPVAEDLNHPRCCASEWGTQYRGKGILREDTHVGRWPHAGGHGWIAPESFPSERCPAEYSLSEIACLRGGAVRVTSAPLGEWVAGAWNKARAFEQGYGCATLFQRLSHPRGGR